MNTVKSKEAKQVKKIKREADAADNMEDPMKYLDWKIVGLSAGAFLSFTFVLCVVYDLIFSAQAMYEAWYRLLPGFKWLTWWSFCLGLVESFLYGIYAGLVFAPLYNFFNMTLGRPED